MTDRPPQDYGLTDTWLRARFKGREAEGPGPISEATWPDWLTGLTSPDPQVRRLYLFNLHHQVERSEIDHLAALAPRQTELIAAFERRPERDLLAMIVTLHDAFEAAPGRNWLARLIASGPLTDELAAVLARSARPLPADGLTGQPELKAAVEQLLGRHESYPARLVLALRRELDRLGPGELQIELDRLTSAWSQPETDFDWWTNIPPALIEAAAPRAAPTDRPGRLLAWGDWGRESLDFWEEVLAAWAGELRLVRQTLLDLAGRTGRVVVALANANLAASMLWALPQPTDAQTGLPLAASEPETAPPDNRLADLNRLRFRRRWQEPMARELGRLAVAYRLNHRPEDILPWQEQAAELGLEIDGDADRWPFRPGPIDQLEADLDRRLDRAEAELIDWPRQQARLLAAATRLEPGRGAVIPVTDKFSASTRAGGDRSYLADYLDLWRTRLPRAILVLIDDSNRPVPSLRRAVAELDNATGLEPFGPLPNSDPAGVMAGQAVDGRLFAWRPIAKRIPGRGLADLMTRRDPDDLRPGRYDPCWKDGVAALLAGLDDRPPMIEDGDDPFPDHLITTTGKWPVGRWCRRVLADMLHRD